MLKERGSGRRMEPTLPCDIAAGFSEGELLPSLNGHVNGRPVNLPLAVGEPWVGIVANRSSGTGGNKLLVRRLVRGASPEAELHRSRLDSCRTEIARGRGGIAPGVPLLGGRGRRWNGLGMVNEQPKVPVTVLPAGTENLAAQHFGLRHR